MSRRGFRRWISIAMVCCGLFIGAPPLRAQDENATSGFQSNHLFESDRFGDDVDMLNGGLTMSVPIGQEYRVSSNLGYQVALRYNSRVWDTSDWGRLNTVQLSRNGNMGLGFSFHFGRIYRDVTLRSVRSGNDFFPMTFYTWVYVSPDGSEHEIGSADTDHSGCLSTPVSQTTDTTFYNVGWTGNLSTWNGLTGTPPVFGVTTPSGIRYTLAHVVQAFDPAGSPYDRASGCNSNGFDPKYRDFNRDFGGWYVTLIEDTKSDWTVINDPNSPRNGQPGYAAWAEIAYDTRPGFEHAIASMRDSAGRHLVFNNDCERDPATGQCRVTSGDPTPPQRLSVRTQSIEVPAFAGSSSPVDATRAVYNLVYEYTRVQNLLTNPSTCCDPATRNCSNTGLPICPPPASGTDLLTRVDYPTVTPRAGGSQRYSVSFGYGDPATRNGELGQRTLPTGVADFYYWGSYVYTGSSGRGGYLDVVASGFTRQLLRKQRFLDPANPGSPTGDWTYTRTASDLTTNPTQVTVKDPAGTETVYYYHASQPEGSLFYDRSKLDDGYAPEWNDGLNYRVEFYQGNGAARKLLRTETRDYEYDEAFVANLPARQNVRMNRSAVTYEDDGGRQVSVSYSDWNRQGQWKTVKETGFDIPSTRTTRTEYFDRDPDHFAFKEISDGLRVLRRTDRQYSGARLAYSIDRATLPVAIGTPQNLTALPGDVVIGYLYDSNGNAIEKQIGDSGVSAGGQGGTAADPDYRVATTWQAGGYQASEQFFNRSTAQFFSWKAADRSLDGNTGLPVVSRDTSGVPTRYAYDALGRPTLVQPQLPEFPIEFDYADIHHAMMRRGDPAVMGSNFTCSGASASDFQMQCYEYDNAGFLSKFQNRPMELSRGFPYQVTTHDILGRITSRSEWTWPGGTVANTTFDYSDPGTPSQSDPFGRARRVVRPDGQVTETRYFGLSSAVTVKGVRGQGGQIFDAATTYYHDGWNRLVYVQTALNGGASAFYGYDFFGNPVHVELMEGSSGKHQVREFEYDALGRLRSSSLPESGNLVITSYDPLNHPLEQVDASGTILDYEFDGAGRNTAIKTRSFTPPGQPQAPLQNLLLNTYDVGTGATAGRLVRSQSFGDDGAWIHTRELDYLGLNGRVSADRQSFAGWSGSSATLGYTYNNLGLPSTLSYPEGAMGKGGAYSVRYIYQNGYMQRVEDPVSLGTHAMTTYNAASGYQEITTWGAFRTRIVPDVMNRPSQIVMGPWNYTLNDFGSREYDSGAYQYDGAGNVAAIGADRFGYDAAMRLVEAETWSDVYRKQTFAYDDFGNMTQKNLYNLAGTQLAHDQYAMTEASGGNRNRIISLRQGGDTADRPITYDSRGNLTHGDTQAARRDYVFDARNRLLSAQDLLTAGSRELARFDYDGDANRVRKVDRSRGLATFFVRDTAGRLMSEFRLPESDARTPEWTKHYIYLGKRMVSLRENQIPSPPGGLRATTAIQGSSSNVQLSWQANAPDQKVTSYKLYRSPQSTSPSWTVVTTTTTTTYTETQPTGAQVQYQLTAIAGGLEGYGSRILTLQAGESTRPSAPTGVTGSSGDRRVDLRWAPNSGAEGVVGYHVYRGPAGTTGSTRITASPVSTVTYADLQVSNGTGYRYLISAVDNVGLESVLSAEIPATPHDLTPPGPPQGALAIADCQGGGGILVSWEPDPWTSDLARYLVYRDPAFSNQTGLPAGARSAGSSLSYTDIETTPGTVYRYQVVSEDTGGNNSARSLQAGATARFPAGVVQTPATPVAASGDGRVKLRIPIATYDPSLPSLRIYRKPNAVLGCAGYEQVAEVPRYGSPGPTYQEYEDNTAPNNVAYDYVVTTVDNQGRESAFSTSALGIPLSHPQGLTQCVENLGNTWADGATQCQDAAGWWYSRLALRWDPPPARPYQPISATNADGTVGYLKGFRIYKHYRYTPGTFPSLDLFDLSTLAAQRIDSTKFYCKDNPDVTCKSTTDCPGSTPFCLSSTTVNSEQYGSCSVSHADCMLPGDCPTGEQCLTPPSDPYLLKFGDARVYTPYTQSYWGNDCLSTKAVYKVYANGNWLTVESDFSDNFDVSRNYDPYNRCLEETLDVCSGGRGIAGTPGVCPSPKKLPPVPRAPTPTAIAGGVTVSWTPPPGACEPATRSYCWVGCTTPPCCPANQVCETCDRGNEECGYPDGVCSSPFQVCDTDTNCPSGQVCQARSDSVAGYQLYITELDRYGLSIDKTKYHFVRPARFVSVPEGQTHYTLTDLADKANMALGRPYQFTFRVATLDAAGRVSEVSPPSAAVSPLPDPGAGAIPAPHSVKTIIWTTNDATKVGNKASTRGFGGVKLAWQGSATYPTAFRGYRVWRSELAGGPFCALLKSDPALGFPVCPDPNANPADMVTTTTDKFLQEYVDKTALQNTTYYYAVSAVTDGNQSPLSAIVEGMDLGHAAQPLSPPAYFKAWAPDANFVGRAPGNYPEYKGIYLRWCANPPEEGVTAYRVYRADKSMGPYNRIAEVATNCLDGSRRCEIKADGVHANSCNPGIYGNCRIVDLTALQTPNSGNLTDQVDQHVYYYVVTAVSPQGESGYSSENAGWPNYDPLFCQTYHSDYGDFMTCWPRYDPDNPPDIPCGDETAALRPEALPAPSVWVSAPYRTIGQKKGGGGDGGPPPPPVAPPTPNAVPRFVYFHLDHLGTPRVITDTSGFVVSKHHYMPFGEEMPFVVQNTTGTRQFTGQEREPETQLDYMMARYYSSALGRFLSPDPRGDTVPANPQSWNRMAYVRNNPMRYSDPRGTVGQDDVDPAWGSWIGKLPAPEGGFLSPEQRSSFNSFAKEAKENLQAGATATAAATLFTLETPPVAVGLAVTSFVLDVLVVGCDALIVWTEPTGETKVTLVTDLVVLPVGYFGGEYFERFFMADKGLGTLVDFFLEGVEALTDFLRESHGGGGTSTEPKGPLVPFVIPEEEPQGTVIVHPEKFCPGGPPCPE